jgi:tripartite-type tricarboxylate transporter receptor subunit TctC
MRLFVAAFVAAIGIAAIPNFAPAQDYPNKAVRVVVPFAPGGGTDISARIAAEDLSRRLGQSFVVENRPGAGTQIGIDLVVKSRPDGYTLLWATSDGLAMLPAVKPTVTFKIPDDLTFVAGAATYSLAVAVNSKLPIKSMAELIAYGKANPGKLRYSSAGIGTGGHLGAALVAKTVGIEMIHIPYQGSAPAVAAAAGGFVDLVVAAPPSVRPFVEAGTVRALATTGREREDVFPNVPTVAELQLPDLTAVLYLGLVAPAGTPAAIVARLREAMGGAFTDTKVGERMRTNGMRSAFIGSDEFKTFIVNDLERWRGVAKAFNIVVTE